MNRQKEVFKRSKTTSKYLKLCQQSLVMRDMQTKESLSYICNMAAIKKAKEHGQ